MDDYDHKEKPDLPATPYKDEGDLLLAVLDYVLDEQLAGRRVNTVMVAHHFHMTVAQAEAIYTKLKQSGEFS